MKTFLTDNQDRGVEQERLFFAHSANASGHWHLLSDHLRAVAELASRFAGDSPWAAEAALTGRLHDLGKYADRFQARLEGKDSGIDHWSQGAWIVLSQYRAIAAALAIQGHHVGLQRGDPSALRGMALSNLAARHPFNLQLSDPDANRLVQCAQADGLQFDTPSSTALSLQGSFAQGKRPRPAGPRLDAQAGLDARNRYMGERIRAGTLADSRELAATRVLLFPRCTGCCTVDKRPSISGSSI